MRPRDHATCCSRRWSLRAGGPTDRWSYAIAGADGEHLRSVVPPQPGGRLAVVVGVHGDGTVLVRQDEGRAELPPGESVVPTSLVRGIGGGSLDTLGVFPSARWVRGSLVSFPGAFPPTLQVVAAGNATLVAWPERFDVLRIDPGGGRTRLRLSLEPPPVELRHRLAFEERVLEGPMPTGDLAYDAPRSAATWSTPWSTPIASRRTTACSPPATDTSGSSAATDCGTRCPQVAKPYALPTTWHVVTFDGRWLGPVTMPARFEPLEIGAGYVLGVQRDAMGVERVRVHAIEKPSGGAGS